MDKLVGAAILGQHSPEGLSVDRDKGFKFKALS